MSDPINQFIGRRLKEARKLKNLSQSEVARRLGLSFQQIQKYEAGSNRIAASRLFELGQVLDVAPAFFFQGLEDVQGMASADNAMLDAARTFEQIEDPQTKERILHFIEDMAAILDAKNS